MPKPMNGHPSPPVRARSVGRRCLVAIAPALLTACSADVVSLGEREEENAVPSNSRCQASTTLEGSVRVESQEQLDALEGCEVITGDLDIVAFPAASFRSLHALTRVDGHVQVGGHTPEPPGDGRSAGEWVFSEDYEVYQASIVDWLPSLEGLEHLERVGALSIAAPVSSLLPLSGLRHIDTGSLEVSSDGLASLAGLEAVRGVDSLYVDGAELRDISAVRLQEVMLRLAIHAPIAELDASELKYADWIELMYTELEDLDALENLQDAGAVHIIGNLRLRHMEGLNRLRNVHELAVQDNDQLEHMGDFASLVTLDSLDIQDNVELTQLPSFPSYRLGEAAVADPEGGPEWLYFGNIQQISLSGNDSLRRFAMPDRWRAVTFVRISGTSLEAVDFVNVRSIGTLIIDGNPLLTDVNLGALASVPDLRIESNHALSPTAFDGVQTVQRQIAGNAPVP
jgi:hypothetical protein